ncbi:hypothetical protein FO519_009549 [Halicephalobus sp. NKZ332]|nr:hypothetical protein FO519_009549 [Halicephalobus sp. NKZ332]
MKTFKLDITIPDHTRNNTISTSDPPTENTTVLRNYCILPSNLEIRVDEEMNHQEIQSLPSREEFMSCPVRSVICNTLNEDLQPLIEQISHFEQVLGKGFSKYDDEEDTEDSTSEHTFIALQNHGIEISLAIFYSHLMTSEIIRKFGNIALHLDLVFFKNSQITKNIPPQ